MTPLRALGCLALTAACAAGLAAASGVHYAPEPADVAALRFAWRAASEPVRHCRTPSAEELAQLPVHMRRAEICERRLPVSRLRVAVDGVPSLDERIEPAGAELDRPAVVLRELRLTPGEHHVRVEFASEDGANAPHWLEATLVLAPREIALVTTAGESGRLVLRRRAR